MPEESMLEFFDRGRPGIGYWGSYAIICVGFILDFYDFFIVSFLLAAIGPAWHLTYGQSSLILLAGGFGAILGSLFFGAIADEVGRKPVAIAAALVTAIGSGCIALVPLGAWPIFAFLRVIVGVGLGGLMSVQIALVSELTPTPYRAKVSGFPIMGFGLGAMLGALTTAALIAEIGWRGVALFGLIPLLVVAAYVVFVPESPRWLVTKQRGQQARASIARLLNVPVSAVPIRMEKVEKARKASLRELYSLPGRFWLVVVIWGALSTCYYGMYLWGPTIVALLMHITVAKAAKYFFYIALFGLVGRAFFSIIPNYIGRRNSGILFGFGVAVTFALAAFFSTYFYAGVSIFIAMLFLNAFFNDGGYSTLAPYTTEIFPVRLAARGVGLGQAANGLGKMLGPYCLSLIAGLGTVVSAQATKAAILPCFLFLAGCGVVVAVVHLFFAPETLGRVLALDVSSMTQDVSPVRTGEADLAS